MQVGTYDVWNGAVGTHIEWNVDTLGMGSGQDRSAVAWKGTVGCNGGPLR